MMISAKLFSENQKLPYPNLLVKAKLYGLHPDPLTASSDFNHLERKLSESTDPTLMLGVASNIIIKYGVPGFIAASEWMLRHLQYLDDEGEPIKHLGIRYLAWLLMAERILATDTVSSNEVQALFGASVDLSARLHEAQESIVEVCALDEHWQGKAATSAGIYFDALDISNSNAQPSDALAKQ